MDFSRMNPVDICEVYTKYLGELRAPCRIELRNDATLCIPFIQIKSRNQYEVLRTELKMLAEKVESSRLTRDMIFNGLSRLMISLNSSGDPRQFMSFYEFVFFICRENGQKSITVSMAIDAWKLVLQGRFRLINQWCDFVKKYQRHNISEDTWQQLLPFSRCVEEDLGGYDPTGAWPVLIDDFVEYMYSTSGVSNNSREMKTQLHISDTMPGLMQRTAVSKRKPATDVYMHDSEQSSPSHRSTSSGQLFHLKRSRKNNSVNNVTHNTVSDDNQMEISKQDNFVGCTSSSPCWVEGSLSNSFSGFLSLGNCVPFDRGQRVPCTRSHI